MWISHGNHLYAISNGNPIYNHEMREVRHLRSIKNLYDHWRPI